MKIIYLNAWHGSVRAPLTEFLKQHVNDTDVFCFQGAEDVMPELCSDVLRDYTEITAHKYVTDTDDFFLATYVKKSMNVASHGVIFEHEDRVGLGIYVKLQIGENHLTVCNIHGMSRPTDKSDTPGRWRQAEGVLALCKDRGPSVIGGDLNVFPTNESLRVFEKAGFRDLIKEYGITNTRNHLIWDQFPENPRQYYSDYAFVSPEVTVDAFVVPDVEIFNHQPLLLDISL